MPRFKTVNDICNQIAVEVGIPKTQNIFSSSDAAFEQLIALVNAIGYELIEDHNWQGLVRTHSVTVQAGDSGRYPLPEDFAYMVNQSGWEQSNTTPLDGPLSSQQWQARNAHDVNTTLNIAFRFAENEFWVFPQPPPVGANITFEYVSRNWVRESIAALNFQDYVDGPSNVVLYEPYLFERLLKLRFLEARGFDTTNAAQQYQRAYDAWSGRETGAPVLRLAGSRDMTYLDAWRNVPDTGYGKP